MTMTLAEPQSAEATSAPKRLLFKTAETADYSSMTLGVDDIEGVVTAIVSVTGVVDEVDDIIVPGAYQETLTKRNPKVCWAHSWEHPIGKVLRIEELMPGDPRLPTKTRDGKPWPKAAGALVAEMKFNLRTDEGRNAFEVVRFYSDTGECEYSIGYNVPPGRASNDAKGLRHINMLELYELSVVLFGAHTMTGTLSIKDALKALIETKRATKAGIDFAVLGVKVGTEDKPPPFPKREDTGTKKIKPTVVAKDDLAQNDADTNLTTMDCPCGDLLVFDTANGWQRLDGSYGHDDGTTHGDHLLPPTDEEVAAAAGEKPAETEEGTPEEEAAETPADEEVEQEAAAAEETGADDEEGDKPTPDFSSGIMVAVYPDPACADAIAAHIAGPDDTTPREDLHVTLAYLGKVGEGAPDEQTVIDAVTRAVEGQPALSGEVGGLGMFPAGDDGVPTYAPVDVAGLGMLREQVVAELGEAVYNDHGFTPHMTLGYDIGLIDAVPPTPISINEVRVVYGNSQRAIALGRQVPEAKVRTYFTEANEPDVEVKSGIINRWFRTSDATLHQHDENGWREVDSKSMIEVAAYDPALDVKVDQDEMEQFISGLGDDYWDGVIADAEVKTLADSLAEEVKAYLAIEEKAVTPGGREGDDSPVGTPGGTQNWVDKAGGLPRYIRMVAHALMRKGHSKGKAIAIAVATMKRWAAGIGEVSEKVRAAAAKAVDEWEAMKAESHATKGLPVPEGKSYPQIPGSYEERQQILRDAIYSQYVDDVDDNGNCRVWVDIKATWVDRVLYAVTHYQGPGDDTTHYLAEYRVGDEGIIDFGTCDEVELTIVPIRAEADEEEPEDDEIPLGDALPLAQDLMAIALNVKTLKAATEGKAGRVLSGANERALRTAMQHLVNVLAAAGIELGDIVPERARPTGNTGSDGDVRREMDPAVDLETTSPSASTKDAGEDTEAKGLRSGEVLTIDMDEHRKVLAEIAALTAEV